MLDTTNSYKPCIWTIYWWLWVKRMLLLSPSRFMSAICSDSSLKILEILDQSDQSCWVNAMLLFYSFSYTDKMHVLYWSGQLKISNGPLVYSWLFPNTRSQCENHLDQTWEWCYQHNVRPTLCLRYRTMALLRWLHAQTDVVDLILCQHCSIVMTKLNVCSLAQIKSLVSLFQMRRSLPDVEVQHFK